MAQQLLPGEVEYLDEESAVDPFAERVGELEDRVAALEAKLSQVKRDAVVALLQMLSDSMRHIASGKMDIPDVSANVQAASTGKWDILKAKHAGTHVAAVIESLQIHGRLSTPQLAANIKTSKQNAYNNIVPKMIKMGIVTRQGMYLVLKEN